MLPESLPIEERKQISWAALNPLLGLRFIAEHPGLKFVAITAVTYYIALFGIMYNALIYVVREFDFSSVDVGIAAAILGMTDVVANGFMVQILQPKFGEFRVLCIGLISFAVQVGMLAFAWDRISFFVVLGLGPFSFMIYSPLSSIATAMAQQSSSSVGHVQGSLASMKVLGGIGAGVFAGLFSLFGHLSPARPLHGFPFLFASLCGILALLTAQNITIPNSMVMVDSDDKKESLLGTDTQGLEVEQSAKFVTRKPVQVTESFETRSMKALRGVAV